MTTLYFSKMAGALCKWNKIPVGKEVVPIRLGEPLCVEYKNFRLVSKHFDWLGASEVAIVNNIRTKQTKEASPDNIIYYDKKAHPKNGILDIDVFDPSQYGNSVCYYSKSYQGNNITISTKFYEIDERFGIIAGISDLLHITSKVPTYGIYLSLTGKFLEGVDAILDRINYKKQLIKPHIIEFNPNDENKPLYCGSYVCLPGIEKEEITVIIKEYTLDDDFLINKSTGQIYDKSYFVLHLSNNNNPELYDFDFSHDTNELLQKLNSKDKISVENFFQINADASNFHIIQNIITETTSPKSGGADLLPLYNQLSDQHKTWFDDNFPKIKALIHKV